MQSDNKRIAKNAVMLTLRSILVAIVGLYTSRVVLEVLGVEDYGIYGVIGGIIGMVSFLNTSMAGATSRFITFELGKGNEENLAKIFSTSLRIHIFIALIVMLLGETIGLWFLNAKMNFPEGKMFAANILYQFTVFSVIVNFSQVPYNAAIIAHEKMSIYAYFEIIFVILKLAIVYVLLVTEDHRLILYAALILALSIFKRMFYRVYCIKHFKETRNLRLYDKSIAKTMLSFSGFDLYGNMCVAAQRQGQPIILNLFYGVIANAGASIATTVSGAISNLTLTIHNAFRPQITKQYAVGNISQMISLMRRSTQFTLLAYSAVAIPFILDTSNILSLWLGQIPPYSVEFLRLIIIIQIIDVGVMVNNCGIKATGNIKWISFLNGTLYLLCPVISYIWLKSGGEALIVYVVNIIMFSIVTIIGWYLLFKQIKGFKLFSQPKAYLRSIIAIALVVILMWLMKQNNLMFGFTTYELIPIRKFISIAITTVFGLILLLPLYSVIALDKKERRILIDKFIYSPISTIRLRLKKSST